MPSSRFLRRLRSFGRVAVLGLAGFWAAAALYMDFPIHVAAIILAVAVAIGIVSALGWVRSRMLSSAFCILIFAAVLTWWLTLAPTNNRPWQLDVARTPWAEVKGDKITIHNVRNFDYSTETNYKVSWETREFDLSKLCGMDLFMNYWGSPAIAHTIISFDFAGASPIAISIETRKVIGQSYSAIRGFFRQFELIYIIADERDVIRVRTNYRHGEDLYLFHTNATPQHARAVFLDYLRSATDLRDHPRWYNAVTTNCTTSIVPHVIADGKTTMPWDLRILLNGRIDQMLYERGRLAGGLPFPELKARAHVNDAAEAADQSVDFSRRIRAGRPGFVSLAGIHSSDIAQGQS